MTQLSYSNEITNGLAGQQAYGTGYNYKVLTMNNPDDVLDYGRGLVKISGDEDGVKLPDSGSAIFVGIAQLNLSSSEGNYPLKSAVAVGTSGAWYVTVEEAVTADSNVYVRFAGKGQEQTITFDADLVVANTVDLKIDGVSMTQVPFNTTHAQTMTDLASQIGSDFSQVTASATGRVITITAALIGAAGEFVVTDVVVLAGASQAGSVVTEVFASVEVADKGLFRTDAYDSTAMQVPSAKFRKSAAAGELAVLEINNP